jgi:hypothetical protein
LIDCYQYFRRNYCLRLQCWRVNLRGEWVHNAEREDRHRHCKQSSGGRRSYRDRLCQWESMCKKEWGRDVREIVSEKKIIFILNTVRISDLSQTSPLFAHARAYVLRTSHSSTLKDLGDITSKISWLVFCTLSISWGRLHFLKIWSVLVCILKWGINPNVELLVLFQWQRLALLNGHSIFQSLSALYIWIWKQIHLSIRCVINPLRWRMAKTCQENGS